jgi:O-antigen ligase
VALAVLTGVFDRFGPPHELARTAYHDFVHEPPVSGTRLEERLFSFSGNSRPILWRQAWIQSTANPATGGGAASFEAYWLEHRPIGTKVRDAHSLYLETLAELGPLGLALLLTALGLPALAAVRGRTNPLVPGALGAYAAFLLHAGADWDWELAGVTLAALLCGAALLVAARRTTPPALGPRGRGASLGAVGAVGVAALVGLLGNHALARSADAAQAGDWAASERWAERAQTLAPWSSEPWRRIGLAQERAADARPFLLRAVVKEPGDWELRLELAWMSTGRDRTGALAEASRLNPFSPEVARYRASLEEAGP